MNNEKTGKKDGPVLVMLLSVMLIVFGLVLYLYPNIEFSIFVRILASVMLLYAIVQVAFFWAGGEYKNIKSYGFSIGLIVGTLGVYFMVNARALNPAVVPFFGVLFLVVSIIMLQYALQIRMMNGKAFIVSLVLAVAVYFVSLFVFLDPGSYFLEHLRVLYILAMASGVLGLLSMILTAIRIRNYNRIEVLPPERGTEIVVAGDNEIREEK